VSYDNTTHNIQWYKCWSHTWLLIVDAFSEKSDITSIPKNFLQPNLDLSHIQIQSKLYISILKRP